MSEHPAVYLPFASHKYRGLSPRVVDDATEMVLDGYTRSASTFAVYALQLAQERPVRLAHHLHAPAQLIAGVRAGLPTLLVIREPRGAILSQLVREPGVAMRDALVAYVRFHRCLVRYRGGLVVGDFEDVTHDFGSVIRRVNSRFGLSLREFAHTPASLADIELLIAQRGTLSPLLLGFETGMVSRETALVEARELARQSAAGDMHDAWIPSQRRDRAKDRLAAEWSSPRLANLREHAQDIYREFR